MTLAVAGCAHIKEPQPEPDTAGKENTSEIARAARDRYQQALGHLRADQPRKAEPILTRLRDRYPELPGPRLNLGLVYAATGRSQQAVVAFEGVIERDPGNGVAYNHLGILHRRAGRFEQALQAYEKALEVAPDYAYAHVNIGILYDLYLKRPKKALAHYKRYQALAGKPDKQVKLWIADLERRVKSADRRAEAQVQ